MVGRPVWPETPGGGWWDCEDWPYGSVCVVWGGGGGSWLGLWAPHTFF